MPEVPPGYVESLPLNYRHVRNDRKFERAPPQILQLAIESYYARVEWMDVEIVGKVLLSALAASPFADNTVVVYTTDHGGKHGRARPVVEKLHVRFRRARASDRELADPLAGRSGARGRVRHRGSRANDRWPRRSQGSGRLEG